MTTPDFGFRRRCAWCGVQLRAWQMNLCRTCHRPAALAHVGPPCPEGSRWGQAPDRWRTR